MSENLVIGEPNFHIPFHFWHKKSIGIQFMRGPILTCEK